MKKDKVEYVHEPHKFVHSKAIGKQYCIKCGLVNTNNEFTRWAVDKGCSNEEHPSYKSVRTKFTNKFIY